jgi:hypothetical protein
MAKRPYIPFRIPLPVDDLRRIDRLIQQGRVPAGSPEEFIVEAVRQRLVEVEPFSRARTDPEMAQELRDWQLSQLEDEWPNDVALARREIRPARLGREEWILLALDAGVEPIFDLQQTALTAPAPGIVFPVPEGVVADEPLFGLHNRDFPSLWAVVRLCEWTRHEAVPLRQFRSQATEEAWRFSLSLQAREASQPKSQPRLTALFPRPNLASTGQELARTRWGRGRAASRAAFEQAALGSVHRDTDSGEPRLHGPLFAWRLAALDSPDTGALVAPTDLAYSLLHRLDGITIEMPHEPGHAYAFFEHLRSHAPGDWDAFALLINGAANNAGRDELIERFQRRFGWQGTVPQTNLQGYIGRAREWGIITPGRGHYELTDLGLDVANSLL